jgi:uncharacterized peroxidase-related enzyme
MDIDELAASTVQPAASVGVGGNESGPDVPAVDSSAPGAYVRAAVPSPDVEALYASDVAEIGHVMNLSRVWSHQPGVLEELFALLTRCVRAAGLTLRQRGVLVSACASTLGDAYCSLAWGARLAREAGPEIAAAVLRGDDAGLDAREAALARWARRATSDPNATTADDVDELRRAGFDDAQIVAITAFVGLRIAFSTVNDALGVRPDHQLRGVVPAAVRDAVTFGRPIADPPAAVTDPL